MMLTGTMIRLYLRRRLYGIGKQFGLAERLEPWD